MFIFYQGIAPFALKRFQNSAMYDRELGMLKLGASLRLQHFPSLCDGDAGPLHIAIRQQAAGTLNSNTAVFSQMLLRSIVEAALEVLPAFHVNSIVHGDISCNNFLLIEKVGGDADTFDVIVNDFSCSVDASTEQEHYFGTHGFSPVKFAGAIRAFTRFVYHPIHDWESFAWTLLHFTHPFLGNESSVLPWMHDGSIDCRIDFVADFGRFQLRFLTKALQEHIGNTAFVMMSKLFSVFFDPRAPAAGTIDSGVSATMCGTVHSILREYLESSLAGDGCSDPGALICASFIIILFLIFTINGSNHQERTRSGSAQANRKFFIVIDIVAV